MLPPLPAFLSVSLSNIVVPVLKYLYISRLVPEQCCKGYGVSPTNTRPAMTSMLPVPVLLTWYVALLLQFVVTTTLSRLSIYHAPTAVFMLSRLLIIFAAFADVEASSLDIIIIVARTPIIIMTINNSTNVNPLRLKLSLIDFTSYSSSFGSSNSNTFIQTIFPPSYGFIFTFKGALPLLVRLPVVP